MKLAILSWSVQFSMHVSNKFCITVNSMIVSMLSWSVTYIFVPWDEKKKNLKCPCETSLIDKVSLQPKLISLFYIFLPSRIYTFLFPLYQLNRSLMLMCVPSLLEPWNINLQFISVFERYMSLELSSQSSSQKNYSLILGSV